MPRLSPSTDVEMQVCSIHGLQRYRRRSDKIEAWRCTICANKSSLRSRRKTKDILVAEHGGRCQNPNCAVPGGYDREVTALDFHHVDPATKEFALSNKARGHSLAKLRKEAEKCILLCANCHREIEAERHAS